MIAGFVRPSIPDDSKYLADRLRKADMDEIAASLGTDASALDALEQGRRFSLQPLTVVALSEDSQDPVAMLGAVPLGEGVGRIWLLGTDTIFERGTAFARQSRDWWRHVASPFSEVTNCVDMRNEVHIRWLKWCGCRFVNIRSCGVNGEPFLEFIWRP